MAAHLTVEQRRPTRRLKAKGLSLRQIGPHLGCSHEQIRLALRGVGGAGGARATTAKAGACRCSPAIGAVAAVVRRHQGGGAGAAGGVGV